MLLGLSIAAPLAVPICLSAIPLIFPLLICMGLRFGVLDLFAGTCTSGIHVVEAEPVPELTVLLVLGLWVALVHEVLPELCSPFVDANGVTDDLGATARRVWELAPLHPGRFEPRH